MTATPPPGAPPGPADEDVAWWTPEREQCLDRVLAGWPKKQIADHLRQHRNTITNWCAHSSFKRRLNDLAQDRVEALRHRRLHETTVMTDKIAAQAIKALDQAATNKANPAALRTAREWMSEYRAFREQERIDTGDNVQRHQHAVAGSVEHTHTLSQSSFRGFLTGAMDAGIIDVTAIDVTDAHALVTAATQAALAHTDILDQLAEEERHIDVESALTMSEKR